MGLFFKSRAEREWEEEFDRRLNDPTIKKDVMRNWGLFKPREVRIADDHGSMMRRNGEPCCGCGRGAHPGDAYSDRPRWSKPKFDHHHDNTPTHDATGGGFMDWLMR